MNNKSLLLAAIMAASLTWNATAQDAPAKSTNSLSTNAPASRRPGATKSSKQAEAASADAKFGVITKSDDVCKSALDAHALADALKLSGKSGAFKGTVSGVFEPRNLAILNFDRDYRSALTALIQGTNFGKFPVLTNLIGKNVVITGTFTNYQGRSEIVLTAPSQIKIVQEK